jgi:oligoribonuclease NrnB/cAMP/cGMP phosphodiesterase (DHH superfamily)
MKYIIYHQVKQGIDCPDGITAAAIAHLANPDAEIIGDSYNSPGLELPRNLEPGDELIIVDFSYPTHVLEYWARLGAKITVIDHHAQQFPMLEGFSGAILDANECGATLTWKHFFPGKPMPPVLKHVRRRDIGADDYYKSTNNCRDSKAITAKLGANRAAVRKRGESVIEYIKPVLKYDEYAVFEHLEKPGEAMLKAEEETASSIASTAFETKLPEPVGIECWGVKIENESDNRLVSQIGAAVSQAKGEGSVCWIQTTDGLNSLRSNGVDISGYAKALGGGGHPQAAGFPKSYAFPE